MSVLVTGPTGAMGQYILEELQTRDDPIRVLALPETLHRVMYRNRIEIFPGALHNLDILAEALQGVEVVFHAAQVVPPPYRDPRELLEINVQGTKNLLDACPESVRRFVLFSTVTVFTPHPTPDTWPVREQAPREAHGNPQLEAYGQSMIEAEDLVVDLCARRGIEYCILRPTTVCGRSARFLDTLIIGLLRNPERVQIMDRMWGTMQWLHGTDLGRAALLAARHPRAANEIFILCGSEAIKAYDVLKYLWEIINPGRLDNPHEQAARREAPPFNKFDHLKIKAALGFDPVVGPRRCIEEALGRLEFYTSASLDLPELSASSFRADPGLPGRFIPVHGD